MGDITLESYGEHFVCIRMRWVDPDTKESKIATLTRLGWQEGLDPRWMGIMLWSNANIEQAKRDYEIVCKTTLAIGGCGK